jgi:hypothetical protein
MREEQLPMGKTAVRRSHLEISDQSLSVNSLMNTRPLRPTMLFAIAIAACRLLA